MLVTEELHLLLTERSGAPVPGAGYRAYAEIAALVVDLMLAGRVTVDTDAESRMHIVSSKATGHTLLDAALARLAPYDGDKLGDIVTRVELDPWDDIVDGLVTAGVLERGRRGLFGLRGVYASEADATPEATVRTRLEAVLRGTAQPSLGDAVILSLLQALELTRRVLDEETHELDDAALARRIDEVNAGVRIGGVVEKAVVDMTQLIMAAVILPMFVNRII